jgi:hypothetical protein
MKFLKNYTSSVPVSQTIARIEAVLIRCEVSGITKEYGQGGKIVALRFHVDLDGRTFTIRLPAYRERALEALWANYLESHTSMSSWDSRRKTKESFEDQAERTAWKIVQDWVEVQMSMIATKQAQFTEVFMPYLWDSKSKKTVFQLATENNYAGLLPEKT